MKEMVSSDAPKRIKAIQFGVLSPQEIVDLGQMEVVDRTFYTQGPVPSTSTSTSTSSAPSTSTSTAAGAPAAKPQSSIQRIPLKGGPNDKRMGVWQKDQDCDTCGLSMADCVGHFGYIKLVLPVFHVGFFKHVVSILQVICKVSRRILLSYIFPR